MVAYLPKILLLPLLKMQVEYWPCYLSYHRVPGEWSVSLGGSSSNFDPVCTVIICVSELYQGLRSIGKFGGEMSLIV